MTGTGWIRVILTISDHFAFLVGSEKCLENAILIFLAHNVKYRGENTKFKNGLKTHLKVVYAKNQKQFHHFWGMLGL